MGEHIRIFGAGGHSHVAADCAVAAGLSLDAFYDDDAAIHGETSEMTFGIPVEGGRDDVAASVFDSRVLVAIGGNRARSEISSWLAEHGVEFATVIHPAAVVGSHVEIDDGSLVVAGAVINSGAKIGQHVIVNTSASVDHGCRISDYVHISPGAHLAADVTVGKGAHIATGASIIPGITVGAWSVVGAGAVVMRDVPEGATVVALPPRVLRR